MKQKMRLPLSILSLLDKNEEFIKKINQGEKNQKARSELIDEVIRRFVSKYKVFNVISAKNESIVVRSDYLDLIYENKGWGEHSLDVWISMIIELELSNRKDNKLPEDTHRTAEVYSIPAYLFEGIKTREEKEKLAIDSIAYLLKTTTPYFTKEKTRTIVYETRDELYYYILDLKGRGSKFFDNLVAFAINYYSKEVLNKNFNFIE
jgi:hypothetical protein